MIESTQFPRGREGDRGATPHPHCARLSIQASRTSHQTRPEVHTRPLCGATDAMPQDIIVDPTALGLDSPLRRWARWRLTGYLYELRSTAVVKDDAFPENLSANVGNTAGSECDRSSGR